MLEEELQIFAERSGLPGMSLGEDGVARAQLPNGIGEVVVDASYGDRPCVYTLVAVDHPSVKFLLNGLVLCDPSRLVGLPMNFVGDGAERVGFVIFLEPTQLYADMLGLALSQILQSLVRLRQS
jgi:hypothetical protein